MFFEEDFITMKKIFHFEYDTLVEFEKLVFLFAFVSEGNLWNYDLKISENLKQVTITDVLNGVEAKILFDKNMITFHEKSESGLYSLFQRIYNNTDNLLDKYVDRIMEGDYLDVPDDLIYYIDKFQRLTLENQMLYKFYSYNAITDDEEEKRKIKQGYITFSAPMNLNDPFECTLFPTNSIKSNINENYFRVFSCTKDYNKMNQSGVENVLMWAHYGDGFKGYCFQYNYSNIVNAIVDNNFINKLIIISGNVHYNKNPQNNGLNPFANTSFQKTVNNVFNKYDIWSYENEYRIALISNVFAEYDEQNKLKYEYFKIRGVEYNKVFVGVNNDFINKTDFKCNQFYKVDADKKNCKLIIREI